MVKRMLLTGFSITLGSYVAYIGLVAWKQREILYPWHMIPWPSSPPMPTENFLATWAQTSGGRCEMWHFRPLDTSTPAPAVVIAHGNGELIDDWIPVADNLVRHGIHVLLVEYPGYGRSEGSPSRKAISKAFQIGYDTLVKSAGVVTKS